MPQLSVASNDSFSRKSTGHLTWQRRLAEVQRVYQNEAGWSQNKSVNFNTLSLSSGHWLEMVCRRFFSHQPSSLYDGCLERAQTGRVAGCVLAVTPSTWPACKQKRLISPFNRDPQRFISVTSFNYPLWWGSWRCQIYTRTHTHKHTHTLFAWERVSMSSSPWDVNMFHSQ